ncbi:MAG: ABC transporter ATP-binding protein/permease [Holosporales bacterium]|nr:ABC transporter ATP-binding protein/permease [Holosporales bacterium]
MISIFRFSKIKKIKLNDITKYKTDIYSNEQTLKQLDTDNLFLTFHGIYFQDPAKLSDRPVFEDLSFAVLPGEFVAITGENLKDGHYIFDLVLRFHKPQSGKIYIAGSHIENIRINSIRSAIGIFNEDFGLIDGTIFDNIAMLIGDYAKIQNVAYNVGLEAFLDRELFDADGDVAIPQEILFRLQMARIAIRRPKIVLIEEPAFFESEENEQIFFDIVKHMAKRKTVIVITGKPMLAINSDKILYLGIKKTIFGSHAELSSDPDYQQFIAINSDLD